MDIIKPGVNLYGLRTEMAALHGVIRGVFNRHNQDAVLTSAVRAIDPEKFSLHPWGFAEDYAAKHIISESIRIAILDDLRIALPMCDVILHGGEIVAANLHYHIEFDPKDNEVFQEDKMYCKRLGVWPGN